MLQRRLRVCLYNSASHCSGKQKEEPPLTEGVSSVQDDRGCIHSETLQTVALSFSTTEDSKNPQQNYEVSPLD